MQKITALLLATSITGAAAASTNYIQNGSFESPSLSGGWSQYSSIPGWYAENNATSGSTEPIEIGAGSIYGVSGYDGLQVLELNSNAPSTVSQNVEGLSSGSTYKLTFEYAMRAGGPSIPGRDSFSVDWNGSSIASFNPTSSTMTSETLYVHGGGSDKLSFVGTGASSYGGLIDNVKMSSVPGPAAALPFIVGAITRLRRRKNA